MEREELAFIRLFSVPPCLHLNFLHKLRDPLEPMCSPNLHDNIPMKTPISRAVPGTVSPGAGFEAPFDMLGACHERVERSLKLLGRLTQYLHSHGVDESARSAALDVLRYFDIAAPAHHQDEERHVFPQLLEHNDTALSALVQRLRADHVLIEACWRELRVCLVALRDANATPFNATTLNSHAQVFIDLHSEHIRLENDMAFPRARTGMSAEQTNTMGQEMAQRRGVKPIP